MSDELNKNAYLENSSNNQFLYLSLKDNALVMRRGMVGRACLVLSTPLDQKACTAMFAKIKDHFLQLGYREQTLKQDIIDGCHAVAVNSDDIRDHPVYSEFFDIGNVNYHFKEGDGLYIWHFTDGLRYGGDLDLADISISGIADGLIIEGDVNVDGIFSQDQYEYPLGNLILGNVFAKSLIHADSHLVIKGDVHVEQTIYGYYNDGSLQISGDVSGEAFISDDHDMWAAGEYRLFVISFDEEEPDWLNPKLMGFNGEADLTAVGEFVRAGKSVVRKGVRYEQSTLESKEPSTDEESFSKGETDEQGSGAVEFNPKLLKALEEFSMENDNMGLTQTLLDWPDRDSGWEILTRSRLCAPSCSDKEKELLNKVLTDFAPAENSAESDFELSELEDEQTNDDSDTGITGFLKKLNSDSLTSSDQDSDDDDDFEQEEENEVVSSFTRSFVQTEPDKPSPKAMKKLGKEVEKLNQKANDLQTLNSDKALPIFTEVIGLCSPYLNIDSELQEFWEHDYMYAMQGRLWCLNDLVEKGLTKLQAQAENLANEIIRLNQSDVFYYSSLGDVLRNAVVLAHNTLAWYGYLRGKLLKEQNSPQATTVLKESLQHCNEALEDADYCGNDTLLVVLENKALILFLLDCPDDAHLITYKVFKKLEVDNHPYFNGIAQSEDYKKWDMAT